MIMTAEIVPEAAGIVVSSLRDARRSYVHFDGVITVEDVAMEDGLRVPASRKTAQAVLRFDDVDFDDRLAAPAQPRQVAEAIAFARGFAGRRLLIHCNAGLCRSPALALAVIADRMGPGRETEAVEALASIRPGAAPNLLVVEIADRLLGRDGALARAWTDRERGNGRVARTRLLRGLVRKQ